MKQRKFLAISLKRKDEAFFVLPISLIVALMLSRHCTTKISYRTNTEYEQLRHSLDHAHKWLWNHPPDGTNRKERRQKIPVIQEVSESLSASKYLKYISSWNSSERLTETLEKEHPALFYLRMTTVHTMQKIRTTRVKQGLVIWYLYNMGYVFKTPETCFGIDLHFREAEKLTDELDFLLITHGHRDHYTKQLLEAMLTAKKPVITRWYPGSTIVKQSSEFTFDNIRVKVDIGDHHHYVPLFGKKNMLMFQIDCGEAANHYTIYHSGDGSTLKKIQPDKPVDILILHVHVLGMPVEFAIHTLHPRMTFVSHVLELSHSSTPFFPIRRWSFDDAFQRIKHLPETQATTLTWGEQWVTPGTELETE